MLLFGENDASARGRVPRIGVLLVCHLVDDCLHVLAYPMEASISKFTYAGSSVCPSALRAAGANVGIMRLTVGMLNEDLAWIWRFTRILGTASASIDTSIFLLELLSLENGGTLNVANAGVESDHHAGEGDCLQLRREHSSNGPECREHDYVDSREATLQLSRCSTNYPHLLKADHRW